MKWTLPFLTLFAIMALTSCSKEDVSSSHNGTSSVMYTFSATLPDGANQTKAITATRYIMEIYKADDLNTRIKRVEQAGNTILIHLDNNTNYVCLFWADEAAVDDNTNSTFNALDLKNVTLNAGKPMTEAFFAKLDLTGSIINFSIALKRAMAQVNMIETNAVLANASLKVTYNRHNSFNTYTSEVTGAAVSTSETFNPSVTTGTLGTLLTFASVSNILTDFTFLYNSTVTNEKKNVPIKANHITNISGSYSTVYFTFNTTLDETWIKTIEWIKINVGTTGSPKWIKVADRNAQKDGTHGATADVTATDYGSYHKWSDATNDPTNVDKAYRACFDFGKGNGDWRLPTQAELTAICGNSGTEHTADAGRKLKWDGGSAWKLYDERNGKDTYFVYFPMAGFLANISGFNEVHQANQTGLYWSSTFNYLKFDEFGNSSIINENFAFGISVRCVKDTTNE